MPVYVSLLRGINVGAHKRIKMERLRASFENLGFEQVKTYIQSGNVIFKTGKASTERLSRRIEEQLLRDFGFSVSVVTRSSSEISAAIENNPFLKDRGLDLEKLHVMFLSERPPAAALDKLVGLQAGSDRSHHSEREIYLFLPNGTADSTLMKTSFDRILGVVTTVRNWRTVNQLAQMCKDCG